MAGTSAYGTANGWGVPIGVSLPLSGSNFRTYTCALWSALAYTSLSSGLKYTAALLVKGKELPVSCSVSAAASTRRTRMRLDTTRQVPEARHVIAHDEILGKEAIYNPSPGPGSPTSAEFAVVGVVEARHLLLIGHSYSNVLVHVVFSTKNRAGVPRPCLLLFVDQTTPRVPYPPRFSEGGKPCCGQLQNCISSLTLAESCPESQWE